MAKDNDKILGPYDIPLDQMMTYRLARVYTQMTAQASRILKETAGLSQTQWRVLVMLDTFAPMSAHQIASKLAMDKGQLSRTIKGMTAMGLITTREKDSDSRSLLLTMTSRGRALYEQAWPAMKARQTALNAQFSVDELHGFLAALGKLETTLRDINT